MRSANSRFRSAPEGGHGRAGAVVPGWAARGRQAKSGQGARGGDIMAEGPHVGEYGRGRTGNGVGGGVSGQSVAARRR